MGVKKETPLQRRMQEHIERRGGYVIKNWGSMISEPGIPDLIFCYKGLFVGCEVKVDSNTPSSAQGIHCRNIWKAGGIACVLWNIAELELVLNSIDRWYECLEEYGTIQHGVETQMHFLNIDDGRKW